MSYVNYAEMFQKELAQKYSRELLTADLTTPNVSFMGAQTIRLPYLQLKGFKYHNRDGGFNRRAVTNEYTVKTLQHDRDVEFFVDIMDVDESNQALAAANLTNVFDEEFAIPEIDCYRLSKMHTEFTACGGQTAATALTAGNVVPTFDSFMEEMDEKEVPEDGRVLYVTPKVAKLLKQAVDINRFVEIGNDVNRVVRKLDGVKVVVVPANRMRTHYSFADGCVAGAGSKQMNMILVHPKSVISVCKHSYIKLWPPGSHTQGDGYLYQNRQYGDLFVIESRINGIRINIEA